jgi:Polymorphic toxin system, DSP-PTPase phosphatase
VTSELRPLPDGSAAVDIENPWLWVAQQEPLLAGMFAPPPGFAFSFLADRGARAVVSLVGPQTYDADPLQVYAFDLHDLYGGLLPADPEHEEAELRRAAACALALVRDGVGVVVHCRAGIGRTGTVIGAVLVALGHPKEQVAAWLDVVQKRRGAAGWPESAWQADQLDTLVRSR